MEANRKTLSYDQTISVCGLRKKMPVLFMGLQDNFSGAGGRAEGSHIIKMMELVGKKDRLKKIIFQQSKKEKSERRYYND